MSSPLPSDTKLGRYVIRSLIGTGGMGEVYLADDTLLRRRTAIKLLTGDYSQKAERLHRFEREAYAASSLNHPNIVTIYEIGSDSGHHFIATEYVDGESLRQRARISPLDFREVIEIAIQVASALTSAHEAGIIHRDIKPENIMLRRDGYVKVLDFGLAKLTDESWHHDTDAEADTQLMIKTEPGRVMGTIDYMSPEQARGREVDPRSDIFSLGVVIYELCAGAKPFVGDTKSDVLAAVLTADAVPLGQRKEDVPPELGRIVNKCLRKDREERYQSTKELLVDLKNLRQELEFAAKLGLTFSTTRSEATELAVTKATDSIGGKTSAPTVGIPPTTVSELFINEVKTHPRRSFILVSILGAVVIAAGFGLYKLVRRTGQTDSFQNMRMTKLTTGGDVSLLALAVSPDGKYVAYPAIEAGAQSLWIRHVATSSNVQIVSPRDAEFTGLTFSSDGSYLYYTIEEKQQSSALYQVPVLGGTSRKLIDNASGAVTFSPDGSRIAFRRKDGGSQLMLANADGSGIRTLSTRAPKEIWLAPAWSPNKQLLVAGLLSLTDNKARLVEVSLDDGKEKVLGSEPWLSMSALVWLSDGSGLVLTGRDLDTKLFQIWFVSYPDGKRRRITNDLSSYAGASLTADGKTLVSVQNQRISNLWVAPNGNADLATKITFETGKDEGLSGLSWTPDGRIVHTEKNSGATDLWVINHDGSNNTQLTSNAARNFYPNVTPDGRFIVFISDRAGQNDIWRIDLDGRNPVQITNFAPVTANPSVSADGKWVLYITSADNDSTIWKSPIDGGPPVLLTRSAASRPTISPSGDKFVCTLGEAGKSEPVKVALFSLAGGEPERLLNLPTVLKSGQIQWDATGEALIYRESKNRVDNLWSQTLNGGPPKQLTEFKSDQIFTFDWSRDGKNVVLARGRSGSDVVMITSFR